jgi:ankyrin repeat protein
MVCTFRHDEVVRILLRNTTENINGSDSAGCTPLFLAVKACSLDIVRQLLRAGVDVNRTENHFSNTALHEAVKRDCLDIVQELLGTNGSGGMAQLLENHLGEMPLFLAIVLAIAQARYDHIFALNL